MQDTSQAKGMNATLQQHWEKIGLAVAILVAAVVLGLFFSAGDPPEVAGLKKVVADVNRAIAGKNDSMNVEGSGLSVPADKTADPSPSNKWIASYRTDYSAKLELTKPIQGAALFVPTAQLQAGTPAAEGIVLSWACEFTETPGRRVKVDAVAWTVERRKGTSGKWEVVADQLEFKDAKGQVRYQDLNWTDTSLEPKTAYSYRVTPIPDSKNTQWIKSKPENREPLKASNEVAVTSVGIWRLLFANLAARDEDKETPGKAYVTVTKYDPAAGEVSVSKIQNEGEKLGWWPETAGAEATPEHTVYSKKLGKSVKVNFDSGCVLKKITLGKELKYAYKECNLVPTATGTECKGVENKEAKHKVNEVQYLDDEGKMQSFQINVTAPLPDRLCEAHGGPKTELTPEEKQAKRAEAAKKLLEEADALWNTKKEKEAGKRDKTAAKAKYKELLERYGDLDEISKRKAELETKVKESVD